VQGRSCMTGGSALRISAENTARNMGVAVADCAIRHTRHRLVVADDGRNWAAPLVATGAAPQKWAAWAVPPIRRKTMHATVANVFQPGNLQVEFKGIVHMQATTLPTTLPCKDAIVASGTVAALHPGNSAAGSHLQS
jgi:hypothetical protein